MIVQCGQCSTKFRVNDSSVGPRGAKVRCSRCQNVFVVMPPGKAPPSEEDEGGFGGGDNRTHAFDTSQFMRASAGAPKAQPVKPKAAAPKAPAQAAAQAPAGDDDDHSTRMVDARQSMEQAKQAEAAEAKGGDENSTRMVDARQFIEQSKAMANEGQGFDEPGGNSTRMMNVADIAKLNDSGSGKPTSTRENEDETRIGPPPSAQPPTYGGNAKVGESKLMTYDQHDQPTAVSSLFKDLDSLNLKQDGQAQSPGSAPQGPAGSSRLVEDAGIQEIAVETMSVPPPTAMSWVISAVSALVLIAGLCVCFTAEQTFAWLSVRLGNAADIGVDTAAVNGVQLGSVRSQLYPLPDSQWAWIVTGSVENTTAQPVRNVDVVAELHDRMGRLVGTATGPVGLDLDPSEIPGDTESLQALTEKALRQAPPPGVDPGAQASFVAVLLDPSLPMHGQQQAVHLAERAPLPPLPAPEPAPAPAPPPPEPTPAAPEATVAPQKPGKMKGLKGRGGKKKKALAPAVIPGTSP